MIAEKTYATSQDGIVEESYCRECKKQSFEIHESVKRVLLGAERDGDEIILNVSQLEEWKASLYALNVLLGRYARAAMRRVDHLQTEYSMAHVAFLDDLLDREACHTATLAAVATSESEKHHALKEKLRTGCAPSDIKVHGSVQRALQLIGNVNGATQGLSDEICQSYFCADRCLASVSE